jgi:hypothetical protein
MRISGQVENNEAAAVADTKLVAPGQSSARPVASLVPDFAVQIDPDTGDNDRTSSRLP